MSYTTEILMDSAGMEFQIEVHDKKMHNLKIRINRETRYDYLSLHCFSMKSNGVMTFSKLYNSNGHFVTLTPIMCNDIFSKLPQSEEGDNIIALAKEFIKKYK